MAQTSDTLLTFVQVEYVARLVVFRFTAIDATGAAYTLDIDAHHTRLEIIAIARNSTIADWTLRPPRDAVVIRAIQGLDDLAALRAAATA